MNSDGSLPNFDAPDLLQRLDALSDAELDILDFGVIGFDDTGTIRRYSAAESRWAGLPVEDVLGGAMFESVAPCMNNFLVAQRFVDAAQQNATLDETIRYVLTLRMRPTPVLLRMMAMPTAPLRYVAVDRAA